MQRPRSTLAVVGVRRAAQSRKKISRLEGALAQLGEDIARQRANIAALGTRRVQELLDRLVAGEERHGKLRRRITALRGAASRDEARSRAALGRLNDVEPPP